LNGAEYGCIELDIVIAAGRIVSDTIILAIRILTGKKDSHCRYNLTDAFDPMMCLHRLLPYL
jgi:hypothetical protein